MQKKISIFSFFSGIGILDLAFEKNGYNIVFVNEYDNLFIESYRYARMQMNLRAPIYGYRNDSAERYARRRGKKNLLALIAQEREKGNLVGFIGGPPCPDFSVAGKNAGVDGENGRLTKIYFDIICRCHPDFFLFENVKGLVKTEKHRAFYKEMMMKVQANDYVIAENVLNALAYGVPQFRERVFMVGIHKKIYQNEPNTLIFKWDKHALFNTENVLIRTWPKEREFATDSSYVSKEHPEQLKSCIAKSAYNYFISELKSETLLGMGDAFDKAIKNKGIAFFLAQKARTEGASEYEIINDWIRLLSTAPRKDADTIKRMIRLSRVINSLEDDEDLPDTDLQQLNTLEAFDYTVNDYFLPVTAGDIFTNSKDEWFVLIGQDCDMARSITRTPKNALAELLPAKVRPQTDFEKWTNDLRSASIYSFRKNLDAGCEVLQVEYQKREYIANEILNLCSFNSTGECKISLSDSIGQEQLMLMPDYMVEYYSKLQQFFLATKTLRIQAEDAFEIVLSKEHSPRLLSFKDFDKTSDTVSFDLKRVCRLTHDYVFYLYKLYLEYRGRQPFQTINLIRQEDTSLPIMYNKEKTGQYLSFRSIPIPDKSNRKNWCWVIDAAELNRVLMLLKLPTLRDGNDDIVLKNECVILQLQQDKQIQIVKAKEKVHFKSN